MIEIYSDENGYYFIERTQQRIEGNYYDREIWSPEALMALPMYARITKRFMYILESIVAQRRTGTNEQRARCLEKVREIIAGVLWI